MDSDLLEELYRRYYCSSLLYCISLCGDIHLAEDILADAFVKAYLSLPNNVPSFHYWLLKVCKNLWIDHLRRQKHLAAQPPLEVLSATASPENLYLANELQRALWRILDSLPPADRELIVLHYFSGMTLQEIAPIMGKNYAAVRQRMVRLRQTIKQRLEDQGYGKL